MSQQTTIRKLAELVNTPVDKLLVQLAEAGMKLIGGMPSRPAIWTGPSR